VSFKIKPKRPKIRHRGGHRLIFEYPEGDKYVYVPYDGQKIRVVEAWDGNGEHHVVTYSDSGRYAWAKSQNGSKGYVLDGGFEGDVVGARMCEAAPWVFRDGDNEGRGLSISQVGIANMALIASSLVGRLDPELANFLGVDPHLCDPEEIIEIKNNPRYAALRNFRFTFKRPDRALGAGRRTENKFRHQETNYDDMLEAGGGLFGADFAGEGARGREAADRVSILHGRRNGAWHLPGQGTGYSGGIGCCAG
jgi:hypothetical protein